MSRLPTDASEKVQHKNQLNFKTQQNFSWTPRTIRRLRRCSAHSTYSMTSVLDPLLFVFILIILIFLSGRRPSFASSVTFELFRK
ncbi:hypothetical protein BDR04DRAFT_1056797 [Suillus decipiens]|nr:hypothetical protein BDR04DRAFT_1056797 [Suillus decipiens]